MANHTIKRRIEELMNEYQADISDETRKSLEMILQKKNKEIYEFFDTLEEELNKRYWEAISTIKNELPDLDLELAQPFPDYWQVIFNHGLGINQRYEEALLEREREENEDWENYNHEYLRESVTDRNLFPVLNATAKKFGITIQTIDFFISLFDLM